MNPADYEVAFKIISFAGNAKSSCMMAIREAREGNPEAATALLVEADDSLHEAHNVQTSMLTDEARGNPVPLNIILIHAQDHLSSAILLRDLADEFLALHAANRATLATS
ncbi:MAG: PTS lactose/cellobiose transporter subunit IIA [Propionibacteriaceae bacterium]|nr:PTS lactose/cellobiose transporter subunit IIA [Micropruina sp.]HBX82489.1 PTS cellobiose transporter subunit IIA [Propionibacteriaceae bacterium]HBY24632.1 PTS cellobiose transporter subunit IIA [Propionibacteriaceae bacterium]